MAITKSKIKTMENIEAGECRWPIGDPRQAGFHFCGAKQVAGRPYCQHHWSISFEAAKSRSGAPRPLASTFRIRSAA